MKTPDNKRGALCDVGGWGLSFFGEAPIVRMYLSPPVDEEGPENFIALNVEGLTVLSQLAAEWARWLAAQTGETVPSVSQPDDRERRIRALAREWIGKFEDDGVDTLTSAEAKEIVAKVVRDASIYIDALDAAEVPKKGGE